MLIMPRPGPRCGTISGYTTHYRRGEKPCGECKAARYAYDQDRQRKLAEGTWTPQKAACGTASGYVRHITKGEAPCDWCTAAHRIYAREWRRKRGNNA